MNDAYNVDCMEYMRGVPDNFFDLAVVDPPYGIVKGFKKSSRVARYGQTKTANDDKPTAEYFAELFRVSKNQIIWGYNHLSDMLPTTKEFIFWYKRQPMQKPIALYTWIYQTYAQAGYKILDTHLGSGSSRIAAYDCGLDFVGCEIDAEYFKKQEKRYEEHIAQQRMFAPSMIGGNAWLKSDAAEQ